MAAAEWHRWIGFGLIGAALLLSALRPRAALRFLAESFRFRPGDLRWFASYPGFVLSPRRHDPGHHGGHFDPGQRVMNCLILASFAALSVTGIVMSVPERVTPAAFAVSLKIHVVATVVLAGSVAGHVLVASRLLPAYRGVWRAMHGVGCPRTSPGSSGRSGRRNVRDVPSASWNDGDTRRPPDDAGEGQAGRPEQQPDSGCWGGAASPPR